MDILRNLFGNLSAGIIRLLVTVGILAAVYFFIVKPTLDTTENLGPEANQSIQKSFQDSGFNDISGQIEDVNRQVQIEIKKCFPQLKPERGRQADPLHQTRPPERGENPALQRTVSVATHSGNPTVLPR